MTEKAASINPQQLPVHTAFAMANHRDWYLQQMGITLWELRHSSVLRGEIATILPDEVRLILVATQTDIISDPLVNDVLRTLQLAPHQVLVIPHERVTMLIQERECNSWWLGGQPQSLPGIQLISPPLEVLYRSAVARAGLWQQICEYEQNFFA